MIVLLALGDLVWSISAVASSALLLWSPSSFTFSVCVLLRLLYQWGSWSSLAWSLAILAFLLIALARASHHDLDGSGVLHPVWWLLFAFVAYGWPTVTTIVMLALGVIKQKSSSYHCAPQPPFNLYFVVGPIMGLFFLSVLLFVMILVVFLRLRSQHRGVGHTVTLSVPLRTALFPLVMLICWSLNIVVQLLPEGQVTYALVIAYSVMMNLQGALDCIIYGVTNGRFRNFFRKRMWRTVVLFLFGPVLVIPLFIRRVILFFSRKIKQRTQDSKRHSQMQRPDSPSTSGYRALPTASKSASFFPLSSSSASPTPELGIASSLTPETVAAERGGFFANDFNTNSGPNSEFMSSDEEELDAHPYKF